MVAIPGASRVAYLELPVAAEIQLNADSRDALTTTRRFLTDMVREKLERR